jgi:hypothetical protein
MVAAGFVVAGAAWGQLGIHGFTWLFGEGFWGGFGGPAQDAHLGWALAVGDFDGDGLDDLAVGVPGGDFFDQLPDPQGAGYVVVYRGTADGLEPEFGWAFQGGNQAGIRYGTAVAAGDFDNDGRDDLAIGIPNRAVGGQANAGEVIVFHYPFDVTGTVVQLTQDTLQGASEPGDQFGFSLAAGDLSGDGVDDLAIGVPGENVDTPLGGAADAGAVNVVYGIDGVGISAVGNQYFDEETPGVPLNANANEQFGFALAIAQLAGTPIADLAVGIPGELTSGVTAGGSVMVFPGAVGGLDPFLEEVVYRQGTDGLLGTPGDGDELGYAFTSGDFDGDGWTDLAIGVPGETELGTTESGAVQVLYGGPVGLATFGNQFFVESVIGGGGGVDSFDRFGMALASGDFNADGADELAVGAPLDNSLGVINAGEVTVLPGSPAGLTVAGHQVFDMIFFGPLSIGDEFGFALAAGRFDTTPGEHLAVGVPRLEVEDLPQSGGVLVIRSRLLFTDGFETGDTSAWSTTVQ